MVDLNPVYRNKRTNFYTDKGLDTQAIGSVIQVLKSVVNSYDHQFVPSIIPSSGTTSYNQIPGNALPESNPEYQYEGYLYCDGSEYNIKDYPALYEIIGNDYGGIPSDGIDVISGGSGYTNPTVVISPPPSGPNQVFAGLDPIQATATAVVSGGSIISINVTNTGRGYNPNNPPTVSFVGSGNGATVKVRINPTNGQIDGIDKDNVWEYWPEDMGTFRVPDLIAKRIVGNGPVYGANTPNVGNSELGVGLNTVGGSWYLDKNSQLNQFSLGTITTVGYENVVDTIEASIIGSQVVRVKLQEKKLAGPPQHSHFLLHSEAPQDTNYPGKVVGDRYVAGYKQGTGKINSFIPPGGISFSHTHVLTKAPILDTSVGTYDLFNFSGGDPNSGSIKEPGYYYASGQQGSGTYQLVTSTNTPLAQKFTSNSSIGGRTVITAGVPIYATTQVEYISSGSYTASVPADIDNISVTLAGGGGSGAIYTQAGNNGSASTFTVSSLIIATASGGQGGGAATATTGGAGGIYQGYTITGSQAGSVQNITDFGKAGSKGGDGPYWIKNLDNPNVEPPGSSGAGATGIGANGYGAGTRGRSRFIADVATVNGGTFTYPTTNQTWTSSLTNNNYLLTGITFTLAGGGGANCGNFGGNGCGAAGTGGRGKVFTVSVKSPSVTTYIFQPGQSGRPYAGSAAAAHSGTGGRGGDGYESNDGGGGGAATLVRLQTGNTIIAGAGGGGGGGGFGEGVCGQNGRDNTSPTDAVIETAESIFPGGGATGGNYGCTGGGGGGGGGGVGRAGDTAGGAPGSGGGGDGGHEEGYGGFRGLSAINTNFVNSPTSQSNSNVGEGYVTVTTTENRSYWTSGGGGGSSGALLEFEIPASVLTGISSVSTTIGSGGAAVTQGGVSSTAGGSGYALLKFRKITGYEGGSSSITAGDVFVDGNGDINNGVNFYSAGTGAGSGGGFAFPTNQAPTIVFEGGGGGSGATATATVSNGVITGLSLINPGSGYTSTPRVRILGGVGVKNHAVVSFNSNTGQLQNLTLVSSEAPTTYLKFGGTQQTRYVTTDIVEAEDIQRVTVKVARGNNFNGGELPNNGGDELLLYYNTDQTLTNFTFIGVLVPIPTETEINARYDGTGTGANPTNWYTYSLDLPEDAQADGVRFQIRQSRSAPSASNDNSVNSDHFGILEITYEYKETTKLQFVPVEGKIPVADDVQQYSITGAVNSIYPSGIFANDIRFTLSSSRPIIPVAALDPDKVVPLIEPYFLVKYLIKAY